MIPGNRLIVWTAITVLPVAALMGVLPLARPILFALAGLFLVLIVADAVFSARRLKLVTIRLPEVVRSQKDRPSEMRIVISNPRLEAMALRIAPELPPSFASPAESVVAAINRESIDSQFRWVCTPQQRGRFQISRVHIEAPSHLGFWAFRGTRAVSCEYRVYPNLVNERRKAAAVFLTRGHTGIRARRFSGKGRDFEKLRNYVPGDSYDEIHWRASAKRGHPVTKVFQIERTQEVNVVIDASRLTSRALRGDADGDGGATVNVLERFITAGLMLALAAQQQGDRYGMLTFSDRIERFVPARSGRKHFDLCRDALYTLQPRIVTPNYQELATFIRLRMRKRSLLIVLTALDDPVLAESFLQSIPLISRQHLVLVNMIRPPGADPIFEGASATVDTVDEIYQRLGGHLQWHELRELEKVLQRHGVAFRQLDNAKMVLDFITQYLEVKARQVL